MLVERNYRSLSRKFEILKAEIEILNGSPIPIALSEIWLNNENIHLLEKLPKYPNIVCRHRHGGGGGLGIYVREDLDVKLVLQNNDRPRNSEILTIKVIQFCINHIHE